MTDQATLQGADLLFADEPANTDDAVELTEVDSGAETVDETQSVEETEPDADGEAEVDDTDGVSEDSEDTDESEDSDSDSDEEDVLYLDLDGEDISLDEVRDWRKAHEIQGKVTQKRMEDAKREKQNIANESQIAERLQRTEAMVSVIDEAAKALRDEGIYSDDELKAFESKAEELRLKVEADKKATAESKNQHELDMLIKRNKEWFDNNEWSDKGKADVKFINEYLAKEGFTAEEVNSMTNHKMIMSLHKAAQFDALKKKTVELKKKVKKVPVTSKPKAKPKAPTKPKTAEESVFDL